MRVLLRALPVRTPGAGTVGRDASLIARTRTGSGLRRDQGNSGRALRVRTLLALCLLTTLFFCIDGSAGRAYAVPELLVDIIASHNLALRQTSLEEESYRGEEGVLRIRPEVGRELGLKVSMGETYLRAVSLHEQAEKDLKRAKQAMASRRESQPGEHAGTIVEAFLSHKEKTLEANALLRDYSRSLSPEVDERLDRRLCRDLMIRLLGDSLRGAEGRLRDALGCFVNTCGGIPTPGITTENVRFVNTVFREFVERAPEGLRAQYDLDRLDPNRVSNLPPGWKEAVGARAARIAGLVEGAFHKLGRDGSVQVDPLLFLALIRRESQFDSKAVSHVGAAGLTQIMPGTAEAMGMENVYHPDYFEQAFSILREEREARKEAMAALFAITPENGVRMAAKARDQMQKSLRLKQEKDRLFSKYRRELRERSSDPRLHPEKAVEYGLAYFNGLLRDQEGDISLALASYNAGPHRVRQYSGIPPYGETVRFRNSVLQFYREYLMKLDDT